MTPHTETQAMCERVVAMVTRREKFARTMHQSIYADDLASVLALLARQQETIERLREALGPFANAMPDNIVPKDALQRRLQEWCQKARAALQAKP